MLNDRGDPCDECFRRLKYMYEKHNAILAILRAARKYLHAGEYSPMIAFKARCVLNKIITCQLEKVQMLD